MATYILFWNPGISSYTRQRFLMDMYGPGRGYGVGNWSFNEHEEVAEGDTFYMVRCGEGRGGIVMRGVIESECYESHDWSPRRRKHIYYADIEPDVYVNPWSEAPMLTPEVLTAVFPDFDWYGGPSGRKFPADMAAKLDELWFAYLDENKRMALDGDARFTTENLFPPEIEARMLRRSNGCCQVCGYSYEKTFGPEAAADEDMPRIKLSVVKSPVLKRLFYALCPSCLEAPEKYLAEKLDK